jgi:hypothetical protein
MPTSLVDHTREREGEVWDRFGISCILKQYFTGTVCFPAGSEFGCGDDKEVGVEKEESLELKIGAEKYGIGMDLTVGTKTTKSEKWTIKSEKCKWCKPEICFPDSRVEVWTCFTMLTFYSHDYDKTYFYPGPVSQYLNNCGPDRDGHCGCKEAAATAPAPGEQSRVESTGMARPSIIFTPVSFRRQNQQTASNATDAMNALASLYEQDITDSKFSRERYAIGVHNPGESLNWLYPVSTNASQQISLLSRGYSDLPGRQGPSPFRGRFLPVLALTQRSPNAKAEVFATVTRPSGIPVKVFGESQTRTGLFTLIWSELDFGGPLEPRSKISLQVRLTNPDQPIPTYLSQSYVALEPVPKMA